MVADKLGAQPKPACPRYCLRPTLCSAVVGLWQDAQILIDDDIVDRRFVDHR